MPVHAWSLPGPGDKWPRDSNGQIRICIAVPSARSPRRAALLPNTRCKERSAGALHVNAWRWGGGSGGGGVIGRVWGEVGVVAKKNDGKKNKRGGGWKEMGRLFLDGALFRDAGMRRWVSRLEREDLQLGVSKKWWGSAAPGLF